MSNVKQYTDQIRKAIYGEQVRSSIADAIDTIDATVVKQGETISQTVDTKAPAIICSTSGESIAVTDSSGMGLKGLKVYGKSEQDTTPSPDYPQEIVDAGAEGDIEVAVTGKNLLEPYTGSSLEKLGISLTDNGDGTMLINGTSTGEYYKKLGVYSIGAGEYTFNGCPVGGANNTYNLYIEKNGKRAITDYGEGADFSLTETSELTIYIYIRTGATCSNQVFKPMLRLASIKDNTYEPYLTPQLITIATPNGLPGIPLGKTVPNTIKNNPIYMNGVYWDSTEQQYYISDTENEDGKNVQRTMELILDGSADETISLQSTNSYGIANFQFSLELNPAQENTKVLCSHLIQKTSLVADTQTEGIMLANSNALFFRIKSERASTVYEFKAMLADSPFIIRYILAAPIETNLTAEELEAYKALHTNYPNTTVINDAGAYMELDYVADTKNYIDNKFAELQTALAATNAQLL